jgi:hypothetical protein
MRLFGGLLSLAVVGVSIGAAQEKATDEKEVGTATKKLAPPSAEEQQKAKKQYDELMQAKQKSPKMVDRRDVAAELYNIASESTQPAIKLLFLRQSAEVAAGYDNALAHKACDELLRIYEGPTSDYVAPALNITAIKSITPTDAPIAYGLLTRTLDIDIAAEEFDAAAKHIRNMATLYRFFGDPAQVRQQPMILQKSIDDAKQTKEKAAAAETVLKTRPNDPQANLTVGQYLCLYRGQWKAGLPRLAKGADAKLKTAATKELASAEPVAVADAWYDLLPTLELHAKRMTAAHALELYAEALPTTEGADKARIGNRIEDVTRFINGR